MFQSLVVYISSHANGYLKARVRQEGTSTAIYGADMLKSNPTTSPDEAMSIVTRQLMFAAKVVQFQFASNLERPVHEVRFEVRA